MHEKAQLDKIIDAKREIQAAQYKSLVKDYLKRQGQTKLKNYKSLAQMVEPDEGDVADDAILELQA